MSLLALKETLVTLKSTRLLTSEAQVALDPFRDVVLNLGVSFLSASQTHSSLLDKAYNGGCTVIGRIDDWDIEISVLLLPSENDRVESLTQDQIFEIPLAVLDYDALYQRVIFGQLTAEKDSIPEPTPEPIPEPIPEPTSEPELIPEQVPESTFVMTEQVEMFQEKDPPDEPSKEVSPESAADSGTDELTVIHIKPPILLKDLAERMGIKPFKIIQDLMELDVFASLDSSIEPDIASQICEKHGFTFEKEKREKGAGVHKVEPALTRDDVGNDILCPNLSCRYQGKGKWMRAQSNKAGNGIAAMMTGIFMMMTGIFIMIGLVFSEYYPHVMFSLMVFRLIPAKYRKMSWQDIQKDPSGKAVGTSLTIVGGGIILSLLSGFFFWIFLSLMMVFLIRWGFRKIKAGSSVELGCPKCSTPWGVYPRQAVQHGTRKLP